MIKLLSHAKFSIPDTERQTHGAQKYHLNYMILEQLFVKTTH